jgi:hypothetical protein
MEQLEGRACPSSFGNFAMSRDVQHDVADITADAKALGNALPPSTSLTTLQGDITAVTNAVTNHTNPTAAIVTLTNDLTNLGPTLSSAGGANVQRILTDIGGDLRDLARDLVPPGPARGDHDTDEASEQHGHAFGEERNERGDETSEQHGHAFGEERNENGGGAGSNLVRDIQSDLADVQADVQALASALPSTLQGDLTTLQGDLTTITSDITNAPSNLSTDLTTLTGDLTKLGTDLGGASTGLSSSALSKVERILHDLGSDVSDLQSDVTALASRVNREAQDVQADATELTGQLGSVSPTVMGELTALDTALTKLVSDAGSGANLSADIIAVQQAESTLLTTLNGQISPSAGVTLLDIAFDLSDLAAMKI